MSVGGREGGKAVESQQRELSRILCLMNSLWVVSSPSRVMWSFIMMYFSRDYHAEVYPGSRLVFLFAQDETEKVIQVLIHKL